MFYCYAAFGLTVASDLECPELMPGSGPPDVTIRRGSVPTDLPNPTASGVRYQAAPGRLLLTVDGVARYLIQDGTTITIDAAPEATDHDLRVFLLASALGALLHQRRLLTLHASAVKVGDGCVAFLGRSGIGKSTLAMAFRHRGYPVLTDDLSVITFDDHNQAWVQPGIPQSKLWLDSLARFGVDPDGLQPIRPALEKRAVPLDERFHTEPLPLRRIYVLHSSNRDEIKLRPLTGPNRFLPLKTHTYRFQYLDGLGLQTPHFQKVAALAQQIPVTRVVRPMHPFRLKELVDQLEADLQA